MLTALRSWWAGASSVTNDCRVGLSTAIVMPRRTATTSTCQTCTLPLRVRTASTPASRPMIVIVTERTARLGNRSAITPPPSPRTRVGRNWHIVVMPTAVGEFVSVRTSQSWAMRWTQLPVEVMRTPMT